MAIRFYRRESSGAPTMVTATVEEVDKEVCGTLNIQCGNQHYTKNNWYGYITGAFGLNLDKICDQISDMVADSEPDGELHQYFFELWNIFNIIRRTYFVTDSVMEEKEVVVEYAL